MGCQGSKAGGGAGPKGKKIDDNKILKDSGIQPLAKNQLKLFNTFFNGIFKTQA